MKAWIADFFVIVFNPLPLRTIKLENGLVQEVDGRLVGFWTGVYSNLKILNIYDIETGLSMGTIERELSDIEELEAYTERFDKDMALEENAELKKNCIEAIKKAYDEHPDVRRQVFGEDNHG